ncbi:MAG TPA: hypothetical protein VLV83_23955 [Acidobacteriota bacterium]|nr:hypothetical protein [Acidobacteriota bacterium]
MRNEHRYVAVVEGPFDALRVNRYSQRLAQGKRWKIRQLASALILSNGWLELSLQEAGRLYVSSGGEGVLDGLFRKRGGGSNQDLAAILAPLDYPGQRWSFSTVPDDQANRTLTVSSIRFDEGV